MRNSEIDLASQAVRLMSVQRSSDRVHRHADALLARSYPEMQTAAESEDDEMGNTFRLNSPETHHHHVTQKASALAKIAMAAALGGPLAILAWKLPEILKPAPDPQTIVEPGTDRDWRVLEPIVE